MFGKISFFIIMLAICTAFCFLGGFVLMAIINQILVLSESEWRTTLPICSLAWGLISYCVSQKDLWRKDMDMWN